MWYNQSLIMNNYCPSLDRLREGDRVGIKYTGDRTLHLYVNGYDQGTAIYNMPEVIEVLDYCRKFIFPNTEVTFFFISVISLLLFNY